MHNESFGNRGVPRLAAAYQIFRLWRGFDGLRLRAAYSQGIKEPRFEESFGEGGFGIIPNPHLRPEENHGVEAGVLQQLAEGEFQVVHRFAIGRL